MLCQLGSHSSGWYLCQWYRVAFGEITVWFSDWMMMCVTPYFRLCMEASCVLGVTTSPFHVTHSWSWTYSIVHIWRFSITWHLLDSPLFWFSIMKKSPWYLSKGTFFSITSVEVPIELRRYQKVTWKPADYSLVTNHLQRIKNNTPSTFCVCAALGHGSFLWRPATLASRMRPY